MIYPEAQNKIYSGKLISVEIELENIQNRLDMASFIILATAILTLVYVVLKGLLNGFEIIPTSTSLITVGLYLWLWRISYRFPLIAFIITLLVYSTNMWLNKSTIFSEGLTVMAYRISVPIILLVGIGSIVYSWYCISQIKRKEKEFPDCVLSLVYIVKGEHIYTDSRFYDQIINNIDHIEGGNKYSEITLTNSAKYINYNLEHHSYNKLSQIFIELPLLEQKEIIDRIFECEQKNHINIYLSVLLTTNYNFDWIENLLERDELNHQSENLSNNAVFVLELVATSCSDHSIKKVIYQKIDRIKNAVISR